jgi:hypothetical protein
MVRGFFFVFNYSIIRRFDGLFIISDRIIEPSNKVHGYEVVRLQQKINPLI